MQGRYQLKNEKVEIHRREFVSSNVSVHHSLAIDLPKLLNPLFIVSN